jgi:hypothetical protein
MKIRTFQSVGDILFGADRAGLSGLGNPVSDARNQRGEEELTFSDAIYRFAAGKLVEVSFQLPPVIEIDGRPVTAVSLVEYLKQRDPRFRQVYGFALAPSLGLAVDIEHDDHWTTAFVAGRWDHIK